MMSNRELQRRFQSCLRYRLALPWQKPILNPDRFLRNQLRKFPGCQGRAGTLTTTDAFHLSPFTIVRGESVSVEIDSYGLFEPNLTEAFLRLIQPREVVLDVGMHLGYYATLFALLVGPEGQVHAFEPTPSTREIARHNISRFPQITAHPFAIWSSNGTILFRDYGRQWMAFNSFTKARLEVEPSEPREVEVPTITLDDFRQRLNRKIALIKIDAESAEREIVKGARQVLAMDGPIVSVEVGDEGGACASRLLIDDLGALGYAPWEFRSGRLLRHQPREFYDYDNLVCAPASRDFSQY